MGQRILSAAAAATLVVAIGGCSTNPPPPAPPAPERLYTQVVERGKQIAEILHGTQTHSETRVMPACTAVPPYAGHGYVIAGAWWVTVPPGQRAASLAALNQAWHTQYRTPTGSPSHLMLAVDPISGLTMRVFDHPETSPIAYTVETRCYPIPASYDLEMTRCSPSPCWLPPPTPGTTPTPDPTSIPMQSQQEVQLSPKP